MSLIPAIHSWNLTNYARRLNTNPLLRNEYFWSCLNADQTSLKMMITPALQLMIMSSDQCIEELIGNCLLGQRDGIKLYLLKWSRSKYHLAVQALQRTLCVISLT